MDVPARHEWTFQARYPHLDALVPAAFEQLGWLLRETSEGRWHARVRTNLASWAGESVTVAVAGTTVYVESVSAMPTAVIDWGKNRRNTRRFAAMLHELGNGATA